MFKEHGPKGHAALNKNKIKAGDHNYNFVYIKNTEKRGHETYQSDLFK